MNENKTQLQAEYEKYLNFCKEKGIDPNNADNLRGFIYNNFSTFYLKLHLDQLKELVNQATKFKDIFICYDTITHEKCENDTIKQILNNLSAIIEITSKGMQNTLTALRQNTFGGSADVNK